MSATATVVASKKTLVCPHCGGINELESLRNNRFRCLGCDVKLELQDDNDVTATARVTSSSSLEVGNIVMGHYRIESVLGEGGFGTVYLVRDMELNGKRRALKVIPEHIYSEHEIELLSRLEHPAIPDIIKRQAINGWVYLVLKFGGKRTLEDERQQYPEHRIPKEKLFPWMLQLCDVLTYLHKQSPPIIHRDLKPSNILLGEDDRIMLIDFGIAKEAKPDTMTQTLAHGASTPAYSPPEQVLGTGTNERSDIYALGATFYTLLTGQRPISSSERLTGKELIPPSKLVKGVPPLVEALILKSMNLKAELRPQTIKEFAEALQAATASQWKSGHWIIAGLFIFLLLLGMGAITYLKTADDQAIKVNASNLIALPVLKGDNVVTSPDGLLTIAVAHKEYKIGDKLNIQYAVAKPLYIRLMYVNSSGDKGVFLPDKDNPDVPLVPGVVYHYPPLDAKYEINIEGPKGTDQLIAVVGDKTVPSEVDYLKMVNNLELKYSIR